MVGVNVAPALDVGVVLQIGTMAAKAGMAVATLAKSIVVTVDVGGVTTSALSLELPPQETIKAVDPRATEVSTQANEFVWFFMIVPV